MVEKTNGINKNWLWLMVLLIPAFMLGTNYAGKEVVNPTLETCTDFIPEPVVCDVCEVCEECDELVDYKAIMVEEALQEYIDDLDDNDVTVTILKEYGTWGRPEIDDKSGDWVGYVKLKLELFNDDDADDAEDDDEDYDAPTEVITFEVEWDESRERFSVDF